MTNGTQEGQAAPSPSRTFKANVAAPEDRPEKDATGYAVFNTTLGQFTGPVHRDGKPSQEDAKALLPAGHKFKIVRV